MNMNTAYISTFGNAMDAIIAGNQTRVCFNCGNIIKTDNNDAWYFCPDCLDCPDAQLKD